MRRQKIGVAKKNFDKKSAFLTELKVVENREISDTLKVKFRPKHANLAFPKTMPFSNRIES